ncbi:MAG: hypothetical protein HYZ54_04915 [Ignavibacteriae bacterium]|nr:hypothetical protein [Ignavibacteriota bacterium]
MRTWLSKIFPRLVQGGQARGRCCGQKSFLQRKSITAITTSPKGGSPFKLPALFSKVVRNASPEELAELKGDLKERIIAKKEEGGKETVQQEIKEEKPEA